MLGHLGFPCAARVKLSSERPSKTVIFPRQTIRTVTAMSRSSLHSSSSESALQMEVAGEHARTSYAKEWRQANFYHASGNITYIAFPGTIMTSAKDWEINLDVAPAVLKDYPQHFKVLLMAAT